MHLMLSSSKAFYWTGSHDFVIMPIKSLPLFLIDFWNLTRPPVCIMIFGNWFYTRFSCNNSCILSGIVPSSWEMGQENTNLKMMIIIVIKTLPSTNKTFFFTSNCNTKSLVIYKSVYFLVYRWKIHTIAPPGTAQDKPCIELRRSTTIFFCSKVVLRSYHF